MSARVRIFGIVGSIAVLGVILIVLEARPRPTPLINGERLANAMARYTKDLHSRGEALPRTITLDTLIGQGYLSAGDTKPLQGVELVFHTDAVDTNPQMILVEAACRTGRFKLFWLMAAFSNTLVAGGRRLSEMSANQIVQRTEASRFAWKRIEHRRRPAPVADYCRSAELLMILREPSSGDGVLKKACENNSTTNPSCYPCECRGSKGAIK